MDSNKTNADKEMKQQGNKDLDQKPNAAVGEKLTARKKMGTITMVTPPSFFQNQNRSFCLVNLSKKDKDNFADQINKYFPKEDITKLFGTRVLEFAEETFNSYLDSISE